MADELPDESPVTVSVVAGALRAGAAVATAEAVSYVTASDWRVWPSSAWTVMTDPLPLRWITTPKSPWALGGNWALAAPPTVTVTAAGLASVTWPLTRTGPSCWATPDS